MTVLSEEVNREICGILGLDPGVVYCVELTLKANELAKLTVGSFLSKEQGEKICETLKTYKIEPKDEI